MVVEYAFSLSSSSFPITPVFQQFLPRPSLHQALSIVGIVIHRFQSFSNVIPFCEPPLHGACPGGYPLQRVLDALSRLTTLPFWKYACLFLSRKRGSQRIHASYLLVLFLLRQKAVQRSVNRQAPAPPHHGPISMRLRASARLGSFYLAKGESLNC